MREAVIKDSLFLFAQISILHRIANIISLTTISSTKPLLTGHLPPINEDYKGLPTLYVTVYFHENGADVMNLYGEYTSLNKEELDKLRERMSAYYPKMILGLVS